MEACAADLSEEQRIGLVRPLARFLRGLHGREVFDAIGSQLPVDPLGRLAFVRRLPLIEKRFESLRELGVELDLRRLQAILTDERLAQKLDATAVVHGDLHFRHFLVSDQGELSGIIDWGDFHLNNPAMDLQLYWSFIPPSARPAFLEEYGPVSDVRLAQARFFAVYVNAALLEYGIRERLGPVEREGRLALHRLVQESAE